MAMVKDSPEAYFVVALYKKADSDSVVKFIGPYAKIGAARGQITIADRNRAERRWYTGTTIPRYVDEHEYFSAYVWEATEWGLVL